MPMILGPGGGKLSKRHGSVSIEEYRDAGYLPSALVNYLTLLGWGPEDGREVLSTDELVAEFELERVISSSATFDAKKLEWMNGEHIRALPLSELVSAVLPFARTRYGDRLEIRRFEAAVRLAQVRATTLVQIAEQMAFLFTPDDALEIEAASWDKLTKVEAAADILDAAADFVATCDWTDEIDPRPAIEALGLKPGKVMHVLYTAIEGRSQGLPLFDSISLLGRESALHRLRAARARL
jgi:glutamyl-tRNA synthetase